jgi:hypothetical protein
VSCRDIGGDRNCRSRLWKGTVWVDAEEYQPARIDVLKPVDIPYRAREFPGMDLKHAVFTIDYQRVAKNVWLPVGYCNVLWNNWKLVRVSFESGDFRKADVDLVVEYVESSIQYHLPW